MRVIGRHRHRTEFEPDPVQAYRRGRALDAMLRSASPPVARGVSRGTFAEFEKADAARMLAAARKLNPA